MTSRILRVSAVGYVLVVLYAGLLPWRFEAPASAARAELHAAFHTWPMGPASALSSHDVRLNVAVFAPVGLLIAGGWAHRRRWAVALAAAMAGGLVSVLIEAGQLFMPHRVCSLSDVVIDALAALGGALIGLALFCPTMQRIVERLLPILKGRHREMAAAAIVAALLAATLWAGLPSLECLPRQWSAARVSLSDGFSARPWHAWLIRCAALYAALTLLLIDARPDGSPRRRWLVVPGVTAVAGGLQLLRLVTPGAPPNLAEPVVAGMAALAAAAVAPHLASRSVGLPAVVLATALALTAIAAYVTWLSGGRRSGLPLWDVFWHGDRGWALFSNVRRMAVAAAMSFMLAFYVSLRRNWSLGRRVRLALAATLVGLAGMEAARIVFSSAGFSPARLAEQSLAAAAGAALFALCWRILDRRGAARAPHYAGPDRRNPTNAGR